MRYFIDIDGTLAVYPIEIDKWWEIEGIFKTLEPQDKAIKAVKRLISQGQEVYILSAYNGNFPFAKEEKIFWLDKYLPEVDADHRIFTLVGQKKTDYVPGGVQETDVLLDDYNGNLEAWAEAGGIGIKLLNGINNRKTWGGVSVRLNGTIKNIVDVLINTDHYLNDVD